MEPAYQMPEQKKELTRADFYMYKARMAPYDRKVDSGALLSEEDMQFLEGMKQEIRGIYTVESLSKVRPEGYITGHIESILSLDDLRKRNIEDMKLEDEQKVLRNHLVELRRKGELDSDLEDRLYERITEISRELYPYH